MKTLLTITFLFALVNTIVPQDVERLYIKNDNKELVVRRVKKTVLYFNKIKTDTIFMGVYSDSLSKNLNTGVCVKLPKNHNSLNDHILIYFVDGTCITIYRRDPPTINNYATYVITFSDLYFLETKKVEKVSFDKEHTFKVKSKKYFIDFFKEMNKINK